MTKSLFILFLLLVGCNNNKQTPKTIRANTAISIDSAKIIASMFLYEGIEEGLPYYLEEPDLHKIYETNKPWVNNYFPIILESYDLRYYQRLNIAYYLYLVNEKEHFINLSDTSKLNSQEKEVLRWYIHNYQIEL